MPLLKHLYAGTGDSVPASPPGRPALEAGQRIFIVNPSALSISSRHGERMVPATIIEVEACSTPERPHVIFTFDDDPSSRLFAWGWENIAARE
jgi:hypothetical protein